MKIESKYNIGDKIWFPHNNLYFEGKISKIIGWDNEHINNSFLYEVQHGECDEVLTERLYENEIYKFEDKDLIINNLFIYEN